MRARPLPIALVAVVLALVAPTSASSAATLPADATAVISGTPDLTALFPTPVTAAQASGQSVDHDGGRVAFTSTSDGLVTGDDDAVDNVYVKDMASGAVTLVSVASDGAPSHVNCDEAVISDDGNHVAFVCRGGLVPQAPSGVDEVYERNLTTNQTVLVSRASGLGVAGDRDSDAPTIDAGGAHVAFETAATNLGGGAQTNVENVYRRSIGVDGDATTLIDIAANGSASSADASDPSIDNAGDRVAFTTFGALDPAHDTNGVADVYVRDLTTSPAQTILVSRATGASGAVANFGAAHAAISGDGAVVAFVSTSTNLDPRETAGQEQVYVRQLAAQSTQLVSATAAGAAATNGSSQSPAIDDSGSVVAFESGADNLSSGVPANSSQVYAHISGSPDALLLASRGDGVEGAPASGPGAFTPAISGDGRRVSFQADTSPTPDVVFPVGGGVALRDLSAATTRAVSRPPGSALFANAGGDSDDAAVSADGRYVAFESGAPALGAAAGAILVRDTATGAVTLVSRQDGIDGAPLTNTSGHVAISGDGRRVAFRVETPPFEEIDVRDIPSGRTFVASRADGVDGALSDSVDFGQVSLSDDGSRVAFSTTSPVLGSGDHEELYVRDIDAGRTYLASAANGASGVPANADTELAQISGDGRSVVFETDATNLADGDSDAVSDIHVRTIDIGVTRLVSVTGAGTKGNGASTDPSISRDGSRVSFISAATNFDPAPPVSKVYVRDLAAGTLTVAGRADGVNGTILDGAKIGDAQLSADGRSVAFEGKVSVAAAPGDPGDGTQRVYARNLATGTTRLMSRADGPTGAAPVGSFSSADLAGITADGGCVVFDLSGPQLLPGASPDFGQVYLRTIEPNCGRPPLAVAGADAGPVTAPPVLTPAPARDRTAPRLTHVRLSHTRFRVKAKATTLSLTVSEAATLTVTVDRERPGRRGGTKKHPTCRVVAKAPKKGACVGLSRDGVLRHVVKRAGAVKIVFAGTIGRKRLAVGRHRMVVVARDKAGNASKAVTVRFTVVR